jgi:chemotaxis protein MotA
MDIATVAGLVLVVVAIIGSILAGGDITSFIDVPSLLVVGLGVIGGTMIKWPMEIVVKLVNVVMKAIFFTPADPKATIEEIGNLAETAR